MATYIKTLKEDNGDITYPQTKAGAVLLNNGSDLETELSQYVTAEDIASTSALTPPVQTNMIANGAVTSAKVDFTTFKFPIPDYSNGTSISNSTNTWTAPKCGVVVATLVADTTNGYKNVTISVNGKVVAKSLWTGPTGGYNFQAPAIVPVATGDKVTFSAKDGNSGVDGRVFYPYKWV